MNHQITEIGRIAALYRYPVKSMRGQSLEYCRMGWHGVEGDRRYAFVRTQRLLDFPWLTGRDVPPLVRYTPAFDRPDDPVHSSVSVETPAGRHLPLDAAELQEELAQQAREPIQLLELGRGTFDSAGMSLITQATIQAIALQAQCDADVRRFRPNILVQANPAVPFIEESWQAMRLQFGDRDDSPAMRVIRPIQRCMMINLDPDTGTQEPAFLRAAVARNHQNAGVYGLPERIGVLHVGDPIYALQSW